MKRTAWLGNGASALLLLVFFVAIFSAESRAASHSQRTPEPAAQAKSVTQGTETLGRVDSWAAYASQDKTGRVCYVVGQPQRTAPASFPRKSPMAMVTHRPAEKITNVVSFVEGYAVKDGSEVSLDLGGGSKFGLFTKDDSAWARTADADKAIVAALSKSRQVVVKGVSQKGPSTTDVYSLSGFGKALALIDKACGVKRDDAPAVAAPATRHHPTQKKTKRARHGKPAPQASHQ